MKKSILALVPTMLLACGGLEYDQFGREVQSMEAREGERTEDSREDRESIDDSSRRKVEAPGRSVKRPGNGVDVSDVLDKAIGTTQCAGGKCSCRITYGGPNGHYHVNYGCGAWNTDASVSVSCNADGCTVTNAITGEVEHGEVVSVARAAVERLLQ